MFWKVFRWVGVFWGPTKGLEGLTIGDGITDDGMPPKLRSHGALQWGAVSCGGRRVIGALWAGRSLRDQIFFFC